MSYSAPPPEPSEDHYNVAFLIMDGVYNTELTAPYDIFHHTIFRDGIRHPMYVFTITNPHEDIISFEGLKIRPDYDYTNDLLPFIDILVIPSSKGHLSYDLEDQTMLDFVRETSQDAEFVTSHCDGAFVLAEAGLLDSIVCTTFPSDIKEMRPRYPHLDILRELLYGQQNAIEIADYPH